MQSDSEFVMSMNCFESAMQVEEYTSELLNQFLNPFLNEQSDYNCLSDYVSSDNNYVYYSTQQDLNLNLCYLSQEYYSCNNTIDATSFFAPTDNYQAAYYNSSGSIEYSEEVTQQSQHKRQFSMDEVGMAIEEHHAKKKTKVEPKIKKNVKNKSQNTTNKFCKEGEIHNVDVALNIQSSSSCSSEDESNNTPEIKESSALNLNGKARASKGAATDPQSLYARKRRERINERLRTLQSLVPNGTKVDISTMLEEAVQYVKFLQLQIKLLSSDDKWMYAPLAYNGMDIGLDLNRDLPRDQH